MFACVYDVWVLACLEGDVCVWDTNNICSMQHIIICCSATTNILHEVFWIFCRVMCWCCWGGQTAGSRLQCLCTGVSAFCIFLPLSLHCMLCDRQEIKIVERTSCSCTRVDASVNFLPLSLHCVLCGRQEIKIVERTSCSCTRVNASVNSLPLSLHCVLCGRQEIKGPPARAQESMPQSTLCPCLCTACCAVCRKSRWWR
jgi:hypothetical protein